MPTATLTDVQAHYEVQGRGPALVMIPGLGAALEVFDPIVGVLAERFCVIRMDNRGVGGSVSQRPPRHMSDYSADVLELLDHLQLDRVHLLGLSLGGIIAQRFAIDHPSRVDRLVLISTAHRFAPYLHEIASLIGQALRRFPRAMVARTIELLGGSPVHTDADPRRMDEKVAAYEKQSVSRGAMLAQLRALASSDTTDEEYRITSKTLIVAGEYDALIPHCYSQRMAELIPDSRFVLIKDAGHNPVLECPQRLLGVVCAFLDEARDGRGVALGREAARAAV